MPDLPVPELRQRLLESALAIVDQEGTAGLTVRAVANAAGCSTMGVYTHFKGKPGLVDAVIQWGFDSLDGALAAAYDAAGGGRAGVVASAEAYLVWARTYPAQFQVMFQTNAAGHVPSEVARERAENAFYAHRARVTAAVDSADADPATWHGVALQAWATVHGHVAVELLRETYLSDREVRVDLASAIDAVLPREAAGQPS